MAEFKLTKDALKELEAELEQLKTVGRKEAAEKIKEARSYGDLSENSEYDEAMSDQAKLEAHINEVESIIKNAVIIDDDAIDTAAVHIGSTVTIVDDKKKTFTYKIVGFAQADPANGKISEESPVGKALLDHKKGDKVTVELPSGQRTFKIKDVTK